MFPKLCLENSKCLVEDCKRSMQQSSLYLFFDSNSRQSAADCLFVLHVDVQWNLTLPPLSILFLTESAGSHDLAFCRHCTQPEMMILRLYDEMAAIGVNIQCHSGYCLRGRCFDL